MCAPISGNPVFKWSKVVLMRGVLNAGMIVVASVVAGTEDAESTITGTDEAASIATRVTEGG
jgi:hypothetical protein